MILPACPALNRPAITGILFAIALSVGCQQPTAPSAKTSPVAPSAQAQGGAQATVQSVVTPVVARQPARNPLDADRAFGYLTRIASLGPRPTGSTGMQRQQDLVTRHFEALGAKVSRQEFSIRHPLTGESVAGANLIIEWHPDREDRVLLCAHYDTRPLPDWDPNPRRQREGVFIGANDGASGVAVLMELGHHMATAELPLGVDFVLFDAEELVYGKHPRERGEYFVGSTYFARQYRRDPPGQRYHWGVLLDMVGDAELEILQEKFSLSYKDTRQLVGQIWSIAGRLGVKEFVPRTKRRRDEGWIRDDHLPLNEIAKIPTCNIIDAEYPNVPFGQPGSYWHTEQDLPRNCSGQSLAKVGWVVLEWLRQAAPRP